MIRKLGIAGAALALVAGVALWSTQGARAPGQTALVDLAGFSAEAQTTSGEMPHVPDMVLGDPDAKVTVIEYASYTCPHCATFHDAVLKPLKRDYIETGKVRFILREVYFDRYGLWAAMVARCGGEERYFGISEMLFAGQRQWAASEDAGTVVQSLRRIGRTAGLDDATLDACLNDGAMAQAMVTAYQANATADGVQGTPTLIVNGTKHPNMSYDKLREIIDAELAR